MTNKRCSLSFILFVIGVFFISSSTQIVHAKCTKEVTKGNVVKNEVISSGETQIVCNGGQTRNVTVEAGGRQLIYNDGKAFSTTIKALGFQYVGDGGWAGQTTIKEKGLQIVDGTSPQTLISGGVQLVNGLSLFSKIENGGMEIVSHGGISTNTAINDGMQHINGWSLFTTIKPFELNKNGIRNVYDTSYSNNEDKHSKEGVMYEKGVK